MRSYLWLVIIGVAVGACASRPNAPQTASDGASGTSNPSSVSGSGSGENSASAGEARPVSRGATAGSDAAGATPSLAVDGGGGSGAGAGGRAADGGGHAGPSGSGGLAADGGGRGGRSGSGGLAADGGGGLAGTDASMPVYRIPLRVHTGLSKLTQADLMPVFDELNRIWLQQAGVCFEIEVTSGETNRSDGFDFRYTAGTIPGAATANGLTQSAHSIWSIDHPNLGSAPHPVQNPTARTTAHELGHGLGLAHENPPPSMDCSSPCYCAIDPSGPSCDDYLMRSGTKGYFLSMPEIAIARKNAAKNALADLTPSNCGAPTFQP